MKTFDGWILLVWESFFLLWIGDYERWKWCECQNKNDMCSSILMFRLHLHRYIAISFSSVRSLSFTFSHLCALIPFQFDWTMCVFVRRLIYGIYQFSGVSFQFFFLLVLVASFRLSSFVSLCQFLLFFILISIFIAFSSLSTRQCVCV